MITRFARSFLAITVALLLLATIAFLHPPSRAYIDPWTGELFGDGGVEKDAHILPYTPRVDGSAPTSVSGSADTGAGRVIMPKLENETTKAELGRSTWRLLHTVTLRYPENPTQDERTALESYMYLTSRLYPCGECATEFQALLKQFPPQTASRLSASLWLCTVHNEVNVRLGKPEFDCSKLDAEYDCGCGDGTPASATYSRPTADGMAQMGGVGRDNVTGVRVIKGGKR